MDLREAINKKYICDYKIYLPAVSENREDAIKELKLKKVNNKVTVKIIFLINSILMNGCKKCICYLENTEDIKIFVKELKNILEQAYKNLQININTLTYLDSEKQRKLKLDNFIENKDINIICAVRILDECIDIKECDSIFITYNSKSKIRNIQRICRCNRLNKNKPNKISRIFLWCESYDELPEFLSGLKEYDSDFQTRFRIRSVRCSNNKDKKEIKKVVLKEMNDLNKYIVKCVEYKSYTFEERIEQLKKFVKDNNKIPITTSKNILEKSLGIWGMHQREQKRKNELTDKKIKILDDIPTWYWEKNDGVFDKHCEEVIEFVKKNNKLPNSKSDDATELHLGYWCSNMRMSKKRDKLSDDQIKSLEKIKGWFWDKSNDAFTTKYDECVKFVENHKKLPSKRSSNEQEKALGYWVDRQRKNKKNNCKLTYEEIEKLEELEGWYWDCNGSCFDENYNKLVKFVKDNNKLPSNHSDIPEQKFLGNWFQHQRTNKKKNKLTDEQIKKLEKIDIWYWNKNIDVVEIDIKDIKKKTNKK
jgi:hypothetical protein